VEGGASIGAYLEKQRVLRGISIEELAAQTRIPLRSLIRLETGAFDANPDGFVRGFVRTVADALGLDKDDTLARMLTEPDGAEAGASLLPPSLVPVLVLTAALVSVILLLGLANNLLMSVATRTPPEPQIIYRRDPVRALAIAQADEAAARERLAHADEAARERLAHADEAARERLAQADEVAARERLVPASPATTSSLSEPPPE
jgi:cytoskeletal protein RodZ